MIYYGKQDISEEDIQAVQNVLRSDFLTQGPMIERFERRVAEYCSARYAVAVTNATSALHIACLAADLKEGDSLWTSPITFVASANCARYCGADVEFVDIDSRTYNISLEALENKLKCSQEEGRLPRVVVPVHLAGQSCDMRRISLLAEKYGFTVLEDASHALGADYLGDKVGACKFSDMTVFSFHPVKIITSGEGGMVLTNNKDLYRRMLLYRNHGITRDSDWMTHESDGPWYYQQINLGFNYRMTDIQAALGYSQMNRLDAFVDRRRELAEHYNQLLKDFPLVTPYVMDGAVPSWHIYIVRVNFKKVIRTKSEIFAFMEKCGVKLNLHYIPVHTQPYYTELGHKAEECPNAMSYYEEAMTLPLYYDLTMEQQEDITRALRDALQ